MEATLKKQSNFGIYLWLLFFSLLAIGFVYVKGQTEAPEFKEAIDDGFAISVPVMNCNNFKLKDFKTPGKWSKQFRKRGYDLEKVKRTIETGKRESFIDAKGQSLMRITDPISGDWIVLDPYVCEIWMVAPSHFLY
jgi:hypothetical protein